MVGMEMIHSVPRLSLLTDDDRLRPRERTLTVLAEVGAVFKSPEAGYVLEDAGCRVDHDATRVRLSREVVEHVISLLRPEVLLARSGEHWLPDLLRPRSYEEWEADMTDEWAAAREKAAHLLATHAPPPLPEGVAEDIARVLAHATESRSQRRD